MADLGFGSPSDLDPGGPYDKGFGSPTEWPPFPGDLDLDLGFGSPSEIKIAFVLDSNIVPDEGGPIMRLYGEWQHPGPYRVRFVDGLGLEHPDIGGCYHAKPGKGDAVYTQLSGDVMQFAVPPLDPGTYSIRIYEGLIFNTITIELPDAVEVVPRMRDRATYRIRARYQQLYRTGPRTIQRDYAKTGPTVDVEFPKGMLEAWTHALGQEMQSVYGEPVTVLTRDLLPGETTALIESGLGWPANPAEPVGVFVGNPRATLGSDIRHRFTYTSIAGLVMSGIEHDHPIVTAIGMGTELVLDVASIPPEGG